MNRPEISLLFQHELADIPDSPVLRKARTSLGRVDSKLLLKNASIPTTLVGGGVHDRQSLPCIGRLIRARSSASDTLSRIAYDSINVICPSLFHQLQPLLAFRNLHRFQSSESQIPSRSLWHHPIRSKLGDKSPQSEREQPLLVSSIVSVHVHESSPRLCPTT